jgi:hypothetical protein
MTAMMESTQGLAQAMPVLGHGPQTVLQGMHQLLDAARSWAQALVQGHGQGSLVHDLSVAALAAAVVTLGAVMLLELRSLARLRSSVDRNLARVFEQLDLLRFDNAQALEARTSANAPPVQRSASISGWREVRPPSGRGAARAVGRNASRDVECRELELDVDRDIDADASAAAALRSLGKAAAALTAPAAGRLAAGEARLLAALAQARTHREHSAAVRIFPSNVRAGRKEDRAARA